MAVLVGRISHNLATTGMLSGGVVRGRGTPLCGCRFMTVEGTSKNRIISPGKVLHFYNSPPDSSVESLSEVFVKIGVSPANGVKFFSQGVLVISCAALTPSPPGSGSKSATGLMEWSEPDGAMDAFVMANHQTIYSSSE